MPRSQRQKTHSARLASGASGRRRRRRRGVASAAAAAAAAGGSGVLSALSGSGAALVPAKNSLVGRHERRQHRWASAGRNSFRRRFSIPSGAAGAGALPAVVGVVLRSPAAHQSAESDA